MRRRTSFATLTLTTALIAALAAVPAASQAPKGPKTLVYIDLGTNAMAGMPDLGGLGGFMMRRMAGGEAAPKAYPQSRGMPGGIGRFLDIALYNGLKPGMEAQQLVPPGLEVGPSLPLVPPTVGGRTETQPGGPEDVDVTIHQYWGCGAEVRPGQPKTMTVRMKRGQMQISGGLAHGVYVPDRDIDATPAYALWPNKKNTKRVSAESSMVGHHQITGDGVPASLQFDLTDTADFMPAINLRTSGEPTDAITVSWQPVARSKAYFLAAMGAKSQREFVLWSSAEVPGAGYELIGYLTGGSIDKWLRQKVLLPNGITRCVVPRGIFAATGGGGDEQGMGGVGMLSMVAYGPETNITWPPKPADPSQPWNPEWNVRVRTKSTATAMLGIDLGAMDGDDSGRPRQKQREQQKPGMKGLLQGIFGGG